MALDNATKEKSGADTKSSEMMGNPTDRDGNGVRGNTRGIASGSEKKFSAI